MLPIRVNWWKKSLGKCGIILLLFGNSVLIGQFIWRSNGSSGLKIKSACSGRCL